MRRRGAWIIAALLVAAAAGCADAGSERADEGTTTLTVFAAASLAGTFTEIAADFEDRHDGVSVDLAFGGSTDLVAQIQSGAPADVFASADEATMARLVEDGLAAGDPAVFATNMLQVAVPPDNPASVATLADLARPGIRLVVCAPVVPCGAAARALAQRAGVDLAPVSEEQAVTDVLGKVISGEADAGLVYRTDVLAAGDSVLGIDVVGSGDVVNRYPVVALADSPAGDLAAQFVDLVLSEEGRRVLGDAGFGAP